MRSLSSPSNWGWKEVETTLSWFLLREGGPVLLPTSRSGTPLGVSSGDVPAGALSLFRSLRVLRTYGAGPSPFSRPRAAVGPHTTHWGHMVDGRGPLGIEFLRRSGHESLTDEVSSQESEVTYKCTGPTGAILRLIQRHPHLGSTTPGRLGKYQMT